jgi:hypothetical protein
MKLNNKDLQRAYNLFNKVYFGNELPKNIRVIFDTEGELEDGKEKNWAEYIAEEKLILISERVQEITDFIFILILHEMAHVKAPDNSHGFQFGAVITSLWQKGAYDDFI